ncbi:MAG: branched-chain-amino-acid transaminase [Nitrospinota bacterium]|jgi:branched-chain amino acid aminotransferase|nr:branched-chain-amino-acid transaminase [Nitrospinota bacterium]|tara:strand:- start:139 stop:1077 length:939 start_codon:yes stop_codon:yes gene_type:complete
MPKYEQHKVWLNGKIVPPEEAKISVFSQAVLRGGSVYEGLRAYWGAERENLFVWMLDPHLDRLFDSMKVMRIDPPYSREEMREAVVEWIRANDFREDMHCRLFIYLEDAGGLDMKGYGSAEVEAGMFISGGPRKAPERLKNGVNLGVSSWRRISDDSIPPRVKAAANYQNSRFAGVEARVNGYDDALILNQSGKVAEATGACVLAIREGELIAPPVTESILESITRSCVLEMYGKYIGKPVTERPLDRTELYVADEAIMCGSGEEVTPIVTVDRVAVGKGEPGPLTRQIQDVFFTAVRGNDEAYEKGLTLVY